ncbi:MAG: response regulator [Nitrospirae bacterium]|nr:response regulator [Nitrospirota bacterium]
MQAKILIVEDEKDITDLVSYNLTKEGCHIDSAGDGEEALEKIKSGKYDLMILDLMLPALSGLEICRIIRSNPDTASLPIIMLTAKGEEVDRILGLEMGADDYVTKPFSPRELAARVKAVLRRTSGKPAPEKIIESGDLVINKETYLVTRKGKPIKLSATEFKLLLFLAERKGKIFDRDRILDAVWRNEAFVEPRTVDVHIRRLRAQIEEDPDHPRYIKTMRGVGYYFDGN